LPVVELEHPAEIWGIWCDATANLVTPISPVPRDYNSWLLEGAFHLEVTYPPGEVVAVVADWEMRAPAISSGFDGLEEMQSRIEWHRLPMNTNGPDFVVPLVKAYYIDEFRQSRWSLLEPWESFKRYENGAIYFTLGTPPGNWVDALAYVRGYSQFFETGIAEGPDAQNNARFYDRRIVLDQMYVIGDYHDGLVHGGIIPGSSTQAWLQYPGISKDTGLPPWVDDPQVSLVVDAAATRLREWCESLRSALTARGVEVANFSGPVPPTEDFDGTLNSALNRLASAIRGVRTQALQIQGRKGEAASGRGVTVK